MAAAIIAAGLLAAGATPADCGGKCYGVATWNPDAYWGTISYLNASSLHIDDHCGSFAANISWIIDQTSWKWIETGLINGRHAWEPGCFGLFYFWAEDSTCYGFYGESWGGVAYNTDFIARIDNTGGDGWQILRNGSPLGWVACHNGPIWVAETGLELYGNTGFNADVRRHSLQKKNASGGWSYGWPGSSPKPSGANAAWCGTWCIRGWLLG